MAALGETFVTIVVEITVRRVRIPKTALAMLPIAWVGEEKKIGPQNTAMS